MSKAQIITCAVIKGGTGKTSTAAALAQAASKDNKRVLVIDLDPQGNCSLWLGADIIQAGAFELLQGFDITETIQTTEQRIDVIAGAPRLATDKPNKTKSIYRLSEALEKVKKAYDLIVIDTPPFFCELTYEALQAATGLLVPLETDAGSLTGQQNIIDLAKQIKKTNKSLRLLGCVITQYNARIKVNQILRDKIAEQGQALKCPLLCEIRQGCAIREAQGLKCNIFEYAPRSKPVQDYRELYKMIVK